MTNMVQVTLRRVGHEAPFAITYFSASSAPGHKLGWCRDQIEAEGLRLGQVEVRHDKGPWFPFADPSCN